jgi:hypothetical protein
MGIYNDSRLVFGWQIDFKTIQAYADKVDFDVCELEYFISKKFPNVHFVYTNPFYDAYGSQRNYYISLLKDATKAASLDQIVEVHSQNLQSAIAFMKNELNIEVSETPMIYSLPHIW